MDQDNQNQNEEEYEEENMMNLEQNENENNNQEDEEAQDVFAFDIQINDDSYLLVIGKTEENKILLRLMDKVDQTKPFFQNEFSLDDLKNINEIFKSIDDEDIAFQYLASNLNDSEKEIKIIDDSKIKFIIYITDEDEKIEIDFVLFKSMDEVPNENENEHENEEELMEEAVEIMNDVIDNNNNNDNEINNENEINNNINENEVKNQTGEKKEEEKKLTISVGNDVEDKKNENENLEIKDQNINENKNINVNLTSIIENNSMNEKNVIKEKKPQSEIDVNNINKDMKLMKEELLNVINTMNETFENKILVQNEAFTKMKEDLIKENEGKIKILKEELNDKDKLITTLQNTINNLEQKLNSYETTINDMNNKFENLNNNLNNLNNKNNVQNDEEKFNDKINIELKDNINIVEDKINKLKTEYENDKNNNDNNIQILDEKINNLENQLKLNQIQIESKNEDNKKILDLENNLKNLDNKLNNYNIQKIIENISILTESQNNTKIFESINNFQIEINELREKINTQINELKNENLLNPKNINNDPELIEKINNQENIISSMQSQLIQIQQEKNNMNNNNNNITQTINEITNTINDLNSKIDSLFTITSKLSKQNSDFEIRTNNIISEISKLSTKITTAKITHQENNIISRGNNNRPMEAQAVFNQNIYYNKTTPNISTSKNIFNSNIVNFEDILFVINRLKKLHPKIPEINLALVYRASEDGDRAADFHKKCDRIGHNLVIIKTRKGNIFGGFTFKNWEHMPRDIDEKRPNLGSASRDSRAFGFNVNIQKIYENEKPNEFAIWCNKNYGPTFKNNLFQIFDSCMKKGGYCSVRTNSHFGGQLTDFEIAGGESRFRVEELEVYEVRNK